MARKKDRLASLLSLNAGFFFFVRSQTLKTGKMTRANQTKTFLPAFCKEGFSQDALGEQGLRKSALLIHGMTGTPVEMRGLATHLSSKGFASEVPLLSGHGG